MYCDNASPKKRATEYPFLENISSTLTMLNKLEKEKNYHKMTGFGITAKIVN